jgi:Luciferase-like monooxygenase
MDYRHDLILGMFITPQNEHPQDVVKLAQLTEQAGLDLVTFMDQPYNPGFLDTWMLLSYVAAKTERVRLSGYVLSSAFRTPGTPSSGSGDLGPPVLGPLRTRRRPDQYQRVGRNRGHGPGAAHASGVRECAQ